MFSLSPEGLELVEIAPGIDLQTQVQSKFLPTTFPSIAPRKSGREENASFCCCLSDSFIWLDVSSLSLQCYSTENPLYA